MTGDKIDGMKEIGLRFWQEHVPKFWAHVPALYVGIFFLSGIGAALHLGCFGVCAFLPAKKASILGVAALCVGYLYCTWTFSDGLHIQEGGEVGTAFVHINRIKRHSSPFKNSLAYEVTLLSFHTKDRKMRHLPCRIYVPHKDRPPAHQDYCISSVKLLETAPYRYVIKTTKKSLWHPYRASRGFAEWRYQKKEAVRRRIASRWATSQVRALIGALATADLEHRLLGFAFNQLGLQHLLAISGFHFALFSWLILLFFRKALPERIARLATLMVLALYTFYLGEIPSVSRASIGVFLFLIASYFGYQFSILNVLGVALLLGGIKNPLIVVSVGFQLSFAATLGILLGYRPFEKALRNILPKRTLTEAFAFGFLARMGYLCTTFLRKALALNCAVTFATLPLLLFHFREFPWLGLLYNLFFPLLFSPMLLLILLSFLCPFFSPCAEAYALFLIALVSYPPKRFSVFLLSQSFSFERVLVVMLVLFGLGIFFHKSSRALSRYVRGSS